MAGSLERLPRAVVGTGLSFLLEAVFFGVDTAELWVVSPLILNDVVALLEFDIAVRWWSANAVKKVPT